MKPGATELTALGLTVAPVQGGKPGSKTEGVVVRKVDGASDAAAKGLKAGDVILEVQGQAVTTPADVTTGVKKATDDGRKAVLMRVKQGETTRFVAVQLSATR